MWRIKTQKGNTEGHGRGDQNGALEVLIPVEADVHNFDKEQDGPHQREKSDIKVKRGIMIRIRITVFQIRNTACNIGPSGRRERRLDFLSFDLHPLHFNARDSLTRSMFFNYC
jgi:hypothetical protein